MMWNGSALSNIHHGVYLSGIGAITKQGLEAHDITFILNVAQELTDYVYPRDALDVTRVSLRDMPDEDLLPHFDSCVDHIHDIVTQGGHILVHCVAGVSRSASICMAYLMKYQQMSLRESYHHIYHRRNVIYPNTGFWRALIEYEERILGSQSVEMRPYVCGWFPDILQPEIGQRIKRSWTNEVWAQWGLMLFVWFIYDVIFMNASWRR